MNNIVRTKTKTRSPSLTARRQDLPIEVTSDQPLVARPNNLPGMGRTNGQLMAGMNDTPLDAPLGRREVEQPATTMPAVISRALSTSRQGVKAFQMGNIIGQWPTRQRAQLERAGRDLFSQQSERKLTMADIFAVSSLTNSETEVKKMAAWVCRHCVPKQRDIQYSFPSASGYQPKAEVWDGDGVRFLLVRETPRDFGEDIDPEGDVGGRNLFYIYGWNEPSANAHRLGSEDRKALTESKADEVQSVINFAVDYYYDLTRDQDGDSALEIVFEDVYDRVDQLGLSSREVADVEKAIRAHLTEAKDPNFWVDKDQSFNYRSKMEKVLKAKKEPDAKDFPPYIRALVKKYIVSADKALKAKILSEVDDLEARMKKLTSTVDAMSNGHYPEDDVLCFPEDMQDLLNDLSMSYEECYNQDSSWEGDNERLRLENSISKTYGKLITMAKARKGTRFDGQDGLDPDDDSDKLNEAIEPDAKDKERAEKLYYSSAKINAMAKAIKDPEKALRRGVAFSRNDINYYEAGLFRARAEELGATEDQLAEFDALEKDARVERSRKFQDEENKKRKAMADAIPAGLVKSIGGDRKVSILWRSRRKVGRISSQYTMSNDFNGEAYYFTPAGSDQQLWLGDNFHTIGLSRYEAEIKLIKEFQIKPVLNEAAESDPMGKTFICVGEGRVEIIEGAEAMSADALEGNRFIVNPNYRGGEDEYRFYGKLDIGRNTFKVDPGLSGKTRLETNVDFGRVVYAIQKQTIDDEPSDFWATWKEV